NGSSPPRCEFLEKRVECEVHPKPVSGEEHGGAEQCGESESRHDWAMIGGKLREKAVTQSSVAFRHLEESAHPQKHRDDLHHCHVLGESRACGDGARQQIYAVLR